MKRAACSVVRKQVLEYVGYTLPYVEVLQTSMEKLGSDLVLRILASSRITNEVNGKNQYFCKVILVNVVHMLSCFNMG